MSCPPGAFFIYSRVSIASSSRRRYFNSRQNLWNRKINYDLCSGRALSKKTAGTTAELAQEIISSISSIFTKTGQLVKAINDETADNPDISRHSESVSDLGDSLDEDTAEALTDGYTMLQGKITVLLSLQVLQI